MTPECAARKHTQVSQAGCGEATSENNKYCRRDFRCQNTFWIIKCEYAVVVMELCSGGKSEVQDFRICSVAPVWRVTKVFKIHARTWYRVLGTGTSTKNWNWR